MQNLETREYVAKHWIAIASKTVTGQYGSSIQFYSRWMISQISSVSFLVYKLLCVESWSTDSWGCGPKTGGVFGDIRGVKISLYAMQMIICKKRDNFRIPYFRPSKCRPLRSATRGGCPLALVPPPLRRVSAYRYTKERCVVFKIRQKCVSGPLGELTRLADPLVGWGGDTSAYIPCPTRRFRRLPFWETLSPKYFPLEPRLIVQILAVTIIRAVSAPSRNGDCLVQPKHFSTDADNSLFHSSKQTSRAATLFTWQSWLWL